MVFDSQNKDRLVFFELDVREFKNREGIIFVLIFVDFNVKRTDLEKKPSLPPPFSPPPPPLPLGRGFWVKPYFRL